MMYLGKNPVALSHVLNTGSGDSVDADTKNTAGATDTSDKIFIVGAKTQAEAPQTYTQDTAYVGADGCLYSNGQKVLTSHQDISGKAPINSPAFTGTPTAPTAASGTNTTQVATTAFVKNALDNIPTGSSDIPLGVCTDNGSALTKSVTIAGIDSLHNGLRISVLFTNGNAQPKDLYLNLNNLGNKKIIAYTPDGGTYRLDYLHWDKQIIDFVYYNECWYAINRQYANTFTPGLITIAPDLDSVAFYGNQAITTYLFRNWLDNTRLNRFDVCHYMEHDQYIGGLSTNEYRCVFRIYFVNSTGKIHYPVSPNDESTFSDLFNHITLSIYGYDSSNNGTLLDSKYIDWNPPTWYGSVDGAPIDGEFAGHHAFYEYVYRFNSNLANTYDYIGGVVTISTDMDGYKAACELTMYHPQQDLTFSLTNLTHNTVTIKNIGIVIDNYMDLIWHALWPSFFNIPTDTIQVPQKGLSDIEEGVYTATPFVGYRFHKFDYSATDEGGYSATYEDSNILASDQRDYPLMCETFVMPGDNAVYFTDYASCKKISMLSFEDATT